jgi:hypothetical protein
MDAGVGAIIEETGKGIKLRLLGPPQNFFSC